MNKVDDPKNAPPYVGFQVQRHADGKQWWARRYVLHQVTGARSKNEALKMLRAMSGRR